MTTPDSSAPFGDATDEAISARLDGELAAFAAERGQTEAEAEAALDAWPGTPARAAALQEGLDAAATPVEPLDDVTRRRLVTGALGGAAAPAAGRDAPRSVGTWWGLAAAAVVAILVVVAIGAMVLNGDDGAGDQASTSAGDGAGGAAAVAAGDLGDLGDVSDPARLRRLLGGDGEDGDAARREGAQNSVPAAGGPTSDSATSAPGQDPGDAQLQFRANEADCAAQLAGSRPVRFVGTGTYQGRAVVVVGLTRDDRTIAFVVPADDCATVLTSVSR